MRPALIHFLDSAMSPRLIEHLARHAPGVPWYGFARVSDRLGDAEFCRAWGASGCVMLKLGLESGDQGVLDALEGHPGRLRPRGPAGPEGRGYPGTLRLPALRDPRRDPRGGPAHPGLHRASRRVDRFPQPRRLQPAGRFGCGGGAEGPPLPTRGTSRCMPISNTPPAGDERRCGISSEREFRRHPSVAPIDKGASRRSSFQSRAFSAKFLLKNSVKDDKVGAVFRGMVLSPLNKWVKREIRQTPCKEAARGGEIVSKP